MDEQEFAKMDAYSKNYELWWQLQTIIVEKEREAAKVTADRTKQFHAMSYNFTTMNALRVGTNTDIVRKFQNDNGEIRDRAVRELKDATFLPTLLGLDTKGRRFLQFKQDDHAVKYFKHAMELVDGYDPTPEQFQHLLSFGANTELLGSDSVTFGFPNIEKLARDLGGTYVDSMRLPALASTYTLVPDGSGVAHPRNIYWAEYYQKVMKTVPTMTFVITAAWVGSKNCWEELEWAATHRNTTATADLRTILVFSHKDHWKEIMKKEVFKFQWGEAEPKSFDWRALTAQIGFYNEEATVLVANNVEEVKKRVDAFVPPTPPAP